MGDIRCVTYGDGDIAILHQGIDAIRPVLLGRDDDRKLSLLLALDRFMDPYFQQDCADISDDLKELLQMVVVSSGNDEVSADALHLLTSYQWPPFPILEQNLARISEALKPDVRYAINMDQENV